MLKLKSTLGILYNCSWSLSRSSFISQNEGFQAIYEELIVGRDPERFTTFMVCEVIPPFLEKEISIGNW